MTKYRFASATAAVIALSAASANAQFGYLDDFNTPFTGPTSAGQLNYSESEATTLTGGLFDTRTATYDGSNTGTTGTGSNNARISPMSAGFIFGGEAGEGLLSYNVGSDSNRDVVGMLTYTDSDGPVNLTGATSITSSLFLASNSLDGLPAAYTITVTDNSSTMSTAAGSLGMNGDVISMDLTAAVANDGLDLANITSIKLTFDWTGVEQADSTYTALRINGIPTPGAFAVLGLGGIAVVRRRR